MDELIEGIGDIIGDIASDAVSDIVPASAENDDKEKKTLKNTTRKKLLKNRLSYNITGIALAFISVLLIIVFGVFLWLFIF